MHHFVLLPGLDGTGVLFDAFQRAAPPGARIDIVSLPAEATDYSSLAEHLVRQVSLSPSTVLVAESFSGPLAINLAARGPIAALILCNTFVVPPGISRICRPVAPLLVALPLPARLVRRYLVGTTASDEIVDQVRRVVTSVPTRVIQSRLGAVLSADARSDLGRCTAFILYPLTGGAAFSAGDADLAQLDRWFGNGASVLDAVRRANREASEVRCWPHHFDIATLITIGASASVGVGLDPGDGYYDEPYFYVNAHPQPAPNGVTARLEGRGMWHTHEWIGAVLPGSRLDRDGAAQEGQATAFITSAVTACRALVSPG